MTIYDRHNEARAYNGMSLLDYFAAKIAAGLAASDRYCPDDGIAIRSYEIAAAMMRRRAELYDRDIAGHTGDAS